MFPLLLKGLSLVSSESLVVYLYSLLEKMEKEEKEVNRMKWDEMDEWENMQ